MPEKAHSLSIFGLFAFGSTVVDCLLPPGSACSTPPSFEAVVTGAWLASIPGTTLGTTMGSAGGAGAGGNCKPHQPHLYVSTYIV
jgi:hypothetical protein